MTPQYVADSDVEGFWYVRDAREMVRCIDARDWVVIVAGECFPDGGRAVAAIIADALNTTDPPRTDEGSLGPQ